VGGGGGGGVGGSFRNALGLPNSPSPARAAEMGVIFPFGLQRTTATLTAVQFPSLEAPSSTRPNPTEPLSAPKGKVRFVKGHFSRKFRIESTMQKAKHRESRSGGWEVCRLDPYLPKYVAICQHS